MQSEMMDPHDHFEWCLRFLNRLFRLNGQNIFQANFHRSKMYYIILTYCIMLLTIIFVVIIEHDGVQQWLDIALFGAALQVGPTISIKTGDIKH